MKKLRLVIASDFHPDVVTLGVSRFEEVNHAFAQSCQYAMEQNADVYVFLGDLVDPDSGGSTFRAISMFAHKIAIMASAGIRVIAIAGNHDVCEDGSGATTLSPLKAFETILPIHIAEDPRYIQIPETDVGFLCLPFTPVAKKLDMSVAARDLWPKDNRRVVVISHLTVPGVVPGEETSELPRGREVLYPFEETKRAIARLQGHYHRQQRFDPNDGGPPMIIPGSLARLTFGEEDHEPAFLSMEI